MNKDYKERDYTDEELDKEETIQRQDYTEKRQYEERIMQWGIIWKRDYKEKRLNGKRLYGDYIEKGLYGEDYMKKRIHRKKTTQRDDSMKKGLKGEKTIQRGDYTTIRRRN